MSRVYLKRTQGEDGDTTTFNLEEKDGTVSNITGATGVRLHGRLEGDPEGDATRLNVAMVIVDAATGQVSYTWLAADSLVTIPGLWYLQVEVTLSPTRHSTYDVAIVTVEREYA